MPSLSKLEALKDLKLPKGRVVTDDENMVKVKPNKKAKAAPKAALKKESASDSSSSGSSSGSDSSEPD
jgi:hypothetical protein